MLGLPCRARGWAGQALEVATEGENHRKEGWDEDGLY